MPGLKRIAVLGAGAWGTGIACALSPRLEVVLWSRDTTRAAAICRSRSNERYLPGAPIPDSVQITADFDRALLGSTLLLAAPPVSGLRPLLTMLRERGSGAPLIWLCKGFEQGSGLLPHQIADEVLQRELPRGVLSGPSFALEVARGLPCALTLASVDSAFARDTAAMLHGAKLRVYYSTDLVGVEIGGAVKNVLAIAVGISDGLGLGMNARAALITRGLAEVSRLGMVMGAVPETMMGLSGAGDLILTATGDLSRNRRVGMELARGRSLDSILADLGHVAEGVSSAGEVVRQARLCNVDMPLTKAVDEVLQGRLSPAAAAELLLARDPTRE